jgi:hypothetical protein
MTRRRLGEVGFFEQSLDGAGERCAGTPRPLVGLVGRWDTRLVAWEVDDSRIVLGPFAIWGDGFEVTVTASGIARDARSQAAGPRDLFGWKRPARTGITPLVGVEYSSGARAANVNDLRPEVQTKDILILRTSAHGRSSGSFLGPAGVSRSITRTYWLSPLPPAGPVRFVCAWPECGIPEHRVEIDASELTHRLDH